MSGSGISWAICKSASRSRQITTPVPHHSVFLQAGCPSCRPTNSVKALKDNNSNNNRLIYIVPPLGDRGHITKQSSVCISVSIGRLEQKCLQLAMKNSGRPHPLQLGWQPVPCSRCDDRESPVVDSMMCLQHDEVTRRWSTRCRLYGIKVRRRLMSVSW